MNTRFFSPAFLICVGSLSTHSAIFASAFQEEIITTATRTPMPLEEALASVTSVSRKDLEVKQPLDLVDVFHQIPSLDISRSGGPGSSTSLYTRGTASGHTLILVDGQRVSSATLGSTNFQFLSPDQIERVEVVRGANSVLYGSDAIGGVIQIFSRDGTSGKGRYISASTGSNSLARVAAGTSGNKHNWHYGFHVTHLETNGIDNLEIDTGYNADDDGYRNRSINASTGYRFENGANFSLHYLESNNRNEHDSAFSPTSKPYSDTIIQNVNFRGKLPVTALWSTELSAGFSTDDSDNFDGSTGLNTSNFRTQREQLFWQNDIVLGTGQVVTLGYDYYNDEVESNSTVYQDADGNAVESRDNSALFGQYQGRWSLVDVVLGLRQDENEEFGDQTSGDVSIALSLFDNYRLIASWSEGFKAPTFNDLYWPSGPYSSGNPALEPETAEMTELSLRGNYDVWRWELTYFNNDVENLIDWAPGIDFVWRPYNVRNAEITGMELSIVALVAGWNLDAAYSYVEPRDTETDRILIKRSRSNLTLNADRELGRFRIGISLKSQDKRYTDTDNTSALGGYSKVDLRLGYALTKNFDASIKVNNLFNKDFQLNNGYHQAGREWQLALRYIL